LLLPSHPIGSGLIAAPFVVIFSLVDRIINHPIINNHNNYSGSWSLFGFVFAVIILFIMWVIAGNMFYNWVYLIEKEKNLNFTKIEYNLN